MSDDVQYMSQGKLDALESELNQLKEEKIPALSKRIDDARQMGDLSENAEYQEAKEEMAFIEGRIHELEGMVKNAVLIEAEGAGRKGVVEVGCTVEVKVGSRERTYTIVGSSEADPASGKISNESPIGNALLGAKKGDKVEVTTPTGTTVYEILNVS